MYLRSLRLMTEEITDWGAYPFSIPIIRNLENLSFRSNVTILAGENGSGKSTLLEAIAYQCGFNPAGGGRNNHYDLDHSASSLGEYLKLSWSPKVTTGFFLRAESFYNFASYLATISEGYSAYGHKPLHSQSHGEAFLSLFVNRFSQKGIYLLDEPEAALSPTRQLALLRIIHQLEKTAQFIIATHSPIIMGYPKAEIYSFDHSPLRQVSYQETTHYQITKRFLENRESLLHELFQDE